MDLTYIFVFSLQNCLYNVLPFPPPLPSYYNYILLDLHCCISASYYNNKSYFYLEKRADSYFKCVVKQQLLSIRIHLHPFFSSIHSLEISFQNLSLSVWNETTRLVPRALAWGCSRWAESESGTSLVQPCGKSFLSDTGAHWLQNQEP